MLFEMFETVANKYSSKYALNYVTYQQLLSQVKNSKYEPISYKIGVDIIIDILSAARENKPLIIPPKFNKNQCIIPNIDQYCEFGLILYSSGSTSDLRKPYFLSQSMLLSNSKNAIKMQYLDHNDNIYTVCSLNHTGGINMQTLPGLLTGAHVIVDDFAPYSFFNKLNSHKISITHLVPKMCDALLKLKTCADFETITRVVAGSDCIKKDHVKWWIDKNINFISNYGLTQAGPVIINHEYRPNDTLDIFDQGVPLGTSVWCNYEIDDDELKLKGDNVLDNNWLNTDDCVYMYNNWFIYRGRKSSNCTMVPKKY